MLRKLFTSVWLYLILAVPASATHISGGKIYYECLGNDQYRITLVVYRDCAGINLNSSYTLNVNSPCDNKTMTVSTPGGTGIIPSCAIWSCRTARATEATCPASSNSSTRAR